MIVAAFEEWYQNTNGQNVREFLFDDLWTRFQARISRWETKGYQVCGFSDDGLCVAFRDQLNRGMRLTRFNDHDFESLQYVEDVDSAHDWTVYISEKSNRTSGFLRTQCWTRIGVKRLVIREYTDNHNSACAENENFDLKKMRRQIELTLADEEGLNTETLSSSSIDEIEEQISIAHLRIQMAVFGQE